MLGLNCYVDISVVAASRSYSLAVGHGRLIDGASLVVEYGLEGLQVSVTVVPGL